MTHHTSHSVASNVFDNTSKMAAIIIGVTAVIAGSIMGSVNPFLRGATSTEGALIDTLFSMLVGIASAIFVIVQGFLLYSIVRFSRDPEDDTDSIPLRGNTRLEVLWTAIPSIIVVAISVYSYQILAAIDRPQPDQLTVEVTARQYAWEFYYPDHDVKTSELHIPLGRQVLLKLTSADVNHAFWVPQMRIKKDAVGGKITTANITGTELGTYPIVCAELCGAGHAVMRSQVVVQSASGFQTWVQAQVGAKNRASAAPADPKALGKQLYTQLGCNACHKLADAGAVGLVGPGLDGIGGRAASIVPGQSAEEYIRTSIVKPNAFITPNYQPVMPGDYGQRMSDKEVDALVQYLLGQK
jgi:cytochrome c oxidase subunit 2